MLLKHFSGKRWNSTKDENQNIHCYQLSFQPIPILSWKATNKNMLYYSSKIFTLTISDILAIIIIYKYAKWFVARGVGCRMHCEPRLLAHNACVGGRLVVADSPNRSSFTLQAVNCYQACVKMVRNVRCLASASRVKAKHGFKLPSRYPKELSSPK